MSRPLSDQERTALATVLAEWHRLVPGETAFCTAACCDWTHVGTYVDTRTSFRAHVIDHLAAVVQTIVDEREAGQG